MLWLVGLMGVASVGAASIVGFKSIDSDEEIEDAPQEDNELPQEHQGDLLQSAHVQNPQTHATSPADPQTGADGDGWGDDILNDAMADFENEAASGAAEPSLPPLILENPIIAPLETEAQMQVTLTDWIADRSGMEAMDYAAEKDSLMLVWDDHDPDAIEPDVEMAPNPDAPDTMQISMDGELVAEIRADEAMDVSDLTLLPLSAAVIIGLMPTLANHARIRPRTY